MVNERRARPVKVTEIYWSPKEGDNDADLDLIPGHVTRLDKTRNELRLHFVGRHYALGDEYEGVLSIRLQPGPQTLRGKQNYKQQNEPWEPVQFSVVGEFQDERFTTFTGDWTEGGKTFRVEIFGLPGLVKSPRRPKRSASRR